MYEIGSYQDKGVKVTMTTTSNEIYLPHLYEQATKRLMYGIRSDPDRAIQTLKEKHPGRLRATVDKLMNNYTVRGIKVFEASMRRGFNEIGMWDN